MSNKIRLNNIKLYGWHGVDEKEKENGQNFEIVDLPGILCFLTEKLSMGITPSEDQLSGCTISCPLHENCVLMASGMNLGGGTIRCKARCIDGGSLGFRGSEAFTAHWGR